MSNYLQRLVDYNNWANRELIEFLGTVPPEVLDARVPGVFGSIRETARHMINSEGNYHAYLLGLPRPPAALGDDPALAEVAAAAEESASRLARLVEQLPDAGQLLETRDGRRAAATVFAQFISHGCEHRAQICTVLGVQGIEPPEVDGWTHGILVHGDDWPPEWGPEPADRTVRRPEAYGHSR